MQIEVEIEADGWMMASEPFSAVREAAIAALTAAKAGAGSEVTVLLADDAEIRSLNNRFRAVDKPTNVLSFPAEPLFAPHLGDVILAYETCAREAADQGKSLRDHLQHLVAHGVLHLLGWDHQSDAEAEAMEALERDVLASLGVADPFRDREVSHGQS